MGAKEQAPCLYLHAHACIVVVFVVALKVKAKPTVFISQARYATLITKKTVVTKHYTNNK